MAYVTGLSDVYTVMLKQPWFVDCTAKLSAYRLEEIFTAYVRAHPDMRGTAASTSFVVAMDEFCKGPAT